MKRILVLFLISFTINSYSQVGYVENSNKIYDFLLRLNISGVLKNYNSFEIPLKRKTIVKYLLHLDKNKNQLSSIDRKKLDYFLQEFDYDINKSVKNYSSFYSNSFGYLSSGKPKYLFFFADSNAGNIFANFIGGVSAINKSEKILNINSAIPFFFGGKIGFTFGKFLGAELKATNGSFFGFKSILLDEAPYKYNYKFTETSRDNSGSFFFDETSGYFTFQSEFANLKIGRDRINFGYGIKKTLFGNNPPLFDYLALNLNYKKFLFSFLHGKLLGKTTITEINGLSQRIVNEKWISFHRFAFDFSNGSQIGIGESVIYYGRGIDLSYLNPFNFYKSAEHANQDRDNSMLFIDFRTNSLIKNFGFYFSWFIDDLDFAKLGSNWYGNNFLWNFGFEFIPNILPSDILRTQIVMIDPYFYTHKFYDNNFTNLGFNLADNFEPNSFNIILQYNFSMNRDFDFSLNYYFQNHGANIYDSDGNLMENHGGNLEDGYRVNDPTDVKYLSGRKEIKHVIEFNSEYEILRGYFIFTKFVFQSLSGNKKYSLYLGANFVL